MNTFRKLLYSYYDVYLATGIVAWRDDRVLVMAAGDDGVTFSDHATCVAVSDIKLQLSDPTIIRRGLG